MTENRDNEQRPSKRAKTDEEEHEEEHDSKY